MRWKNLSNWAKTMIITFCAILVMAIPITRHVILWILPLGSGMDDLVFFVLLFLFAVIALIRLADVETVMNKLKNWLSK